MITNVRIKNFKAIKDTGNLKLNPVSCFIGYNGSGKSSLLEALLTFKELSTENLDKALDRWKGFENIQYKGVSRSKIFHKRFDSDDAIEVYNQPISFKIKSTSKKGKKESRKIYIAETSLTKLADGEKIIFLEESFTFNSDRDFIYDRDCVGQLYYSDKNKVAYSDGSKHFKLAMNKSLFNDQNLPHDIAQWQFLRMNPDVMGEPFPQKRTSGVLPLNIDGSNVAEYLLSIKETSLSVYESILNTMVSTVLPYASDLQSELTSSVDRKIFLNLSEKNYKVPGWLLSTGTLRIVALLAVLRHPQPAPVIVIEELENGLDPRTIHLVISEIRRFTEETGSQVIFTTHSPYLLDLMNLKEIVFVEKVDGDVKFSKPSDNEDLAIWSEKFTPGKLYTMSRLNSK